MPTSLLATASKCLKTGCAPDAKPLHHRPGDEHANRPFDILIALQNSGTELPLNAMRGGQICIAARVSEIGIMKCTRVREGTKPYRRAFSFTLVLTEEIYGDQSSNPEMGARGGRFVCRRGLARIGIKETRDRTAILGATTLISRAVIADALAPFIVVNDQDAPVAWAFTTLHEFTHLWLGTTGISGGNTETQIEINCNDVAGEVLLPVPELGELRFVARASGFVVGNGVSCQTGIVVAWHEVHRRAGLPQF